MIKKEAEKFVDSNLLEGYISVRAVLWGNAHTNNNRKIETVLFAEEKRKSKERAFSFLTGAAKRYGFPVRTVPLAQIDEMTIGNTHGGIVALCTPRCIPPLATDQIVPNGFYVMLQGIEDPYNFGYALRSIYAAGADGVILTPRNWMTAAGVVCRASAGASEQIPMFVSDAEDAAALLRRSGYRVICADADKERSVSMYDCQLQTPLFLIIGGEKRGISPPILKNADEIVRLDYGRDFPAALSAASAAGILAFEVYRQNRTNPDHLAKKPITK